MNWIEVRAKVKSLTNEGYSAKHIHTELQNILGDSAPATRTVQHWVKQFKDGREDVGRNYGLITPENIKKVKDMLLEDNQLHVNDIAKAINVPWRIAYRILEHTRVKRFFGRWVPALLQNDQKSIRMKFSQKCLEPFNKNTSKFVSRFVAMGIFIHHYSTPETKQQSQQSTHSNSRPSNMYQRMQTEKIVASIFWNVDGIILIDYLLKDQSITENYYVNLLDQLNKNIHEKRPDLSKKRVILFQEHKIPYTTDVSTAKIKELKYDFITYPSCAPDLAPSDVYLLPYLKNSLRNKKYSSDQEVKDAVEQYFKSYHEFRCHIEEMGSRWSKCVNLKGDYVEAEL